MDGEPLQLSGRRGVQLGEDVRDLLLARPDVLQPQVCGGGGGGPAAARAGRAEQRGQGGVRQAEQLLQQVDGAQ
ncbi:hypothetical protein EH183_19165 [Streptomyces sp. CB01881]|nr:hypothetical protein EH183_19165 [Streptomyces sp. CB01881]